MSPAGGGGAGEGESPGCGLLQGVWWGRKSPANSSSSLPPGAASGQSGRSGFVLPFLFLRRTSHKQSSASSSLPVTPALPPSLIPVLLGAWFASTPSLLGCPWAPPLPWGRGSLVKAGVGLASCAGSTASPGHLGESWRLDPALWCPCPPFPPSSSRHLLKLFVEIYYWDRLLFEIPHYVVELYDRKEDLRNLRENLLLVARDYNRFADAPGEVCLGAAAAAVFVLGVFAPLTVQSLHSQDPFALLSHCRGWSPPVGLRPGQGLSLI